MKIDPVAIAGIGQSTFARSLDESAGDLAVAASEAAIADAGVSSKEIDGIATFVGAYEGAPLMEVVPRLDLGGRLPTNTHGGSLSEGRSHGMGHVLEVALQLRGTCGERQVNGAKVGFVGNGGGPIAGAVVMTNELP